MERALWIGVVSMVVVGGCADETPQGLLHITPAIAQLGDLKQFEKVETAFRIANPTNADVTILSIKTSCGCVAPSWNQHVIPAGSSDELKLHFSTGSVYGDKNHEATLIIADESSPTGTRTQIARIAGRVLPDIDIEPLRLDMGEIRATETATASIALRRVGLTEPMQIQSVRTPHAALIARIEPPTGHADAARIDVDFRPADYYGTVFSGVITIRTNSEAMRSIDIPVMARIDRDFSVEPADIFIASVSAEPESWYRDIRLRFDPSAIGVERLELTAGNPSIQVQILKSDTAGSQTGDARIVDARVSIAADCRASIEDYLTVRSAGAIQLRVPVRFLFIP